MQGRLIIVTPVRQEFFLLYRDKMAGLAGRVVSRT
jgi:hypothetical protein